MQNNNNDLHNLISATQAYITLPGAVIEKDYYVTQVIQTLSNIENDYFRLIFCGGTCLAKAHKVVNRMSEDIDFKIQIKNNENFSRSRLIKELKEFRTQIKASLRLPNLEIAENIARNEGKYLWIQLTYPHSFPINPILKPDLVLEFTLSDIRLSIESLLVKTIIEDTLEKVTLFTPVQTQCVSVDETAIEKWIGLTRRISAIERDRHPDDHALIRHVYDLNLINQAGKINANFFTLAKTIINNDAKQYKNQHPEYSINPCDEIRQSLALLKNKPLWKERYQNFLRNMVCDSSTAIEYENAMAVIEHISARVIDTL